MTWGKMDDKFHRNRKVRELRRAKGGREALGVWVFWWSWCLDGPDLMGVVPAYELDTSEHKAAQMLVEYGLWDRVDGGYAFHDFHDYNPTAAQVAAKRDADKARIANKRVASRTDVACDIDATSPRVASTRDPVPTRPDPTQSANALSARETPPGVMSPEPELRHVLSGAFGERYQRETRSAFMEHAKCDWSRIAKWVVKTAEIRGSTPESIFADVLENWFTDEWVKREKYPVSAFGSSFANFVERKEKPRPKGQAKAATHEDFARIAAKGVDDVGF